MKELFVLWDFMPKPRKLSFVGLLLMMCLASVVEVISIGAVIPFLAILSNPTDSEGFGIIKKLFYYLPHMNFKELAYWVTFTFILAIILSCVIRLALISWSIRIASYIAIDLSSEAYLRTINKPYIFHVGKNSGEIINTIANKTSSIVNGAVMPCLTIVSSIIIGSAIIGTLILINPYITIFTFAFFLFLYLLILKFTKKKILGNSERIATSSDMIIKQLQQGLGGIRDVLIDGSQLFYYNLYKKSDTTLRLALGSNTLISQTPRFILEAFGMVAIAIFAYFSLINSSDSNKFLLPSLGAFALGAQRLLPLMQQSYASFISIKGNTASLRDVLEILGEPQPSFVGVEQPKEVPIFENKLVLRDIAFQYPGRSNWGLQHISISINKGGQYGIIGATGSGKSTLLDLLMGLLDPSSGKFCIDGIEFATLRHPSWRSQIAHVPQSIFLCDGTIEENIALGIPPNLIDRERIMIAAKQAQISDDIESWDDAYETIVGERGVRLSGGQRQRIGIARALYKKAQILVFDEATSSLDHITEEKTMNAIDKLAGGITVIIVAHRLTTLKRCDQIIEIHDGKVLRVSKYEAIVK
jgi:ATP-binding cassette, subfamily B, bacterial PglK